MPRSTLTQIQPRRALIPGALTAISLSILLAACGGNSDDNSTSPTPTPTPTPAPAPVALTNQLYTQSNETLNAVIHFVRQPDGTLLRKESTVTGGAGSNAVGPDGKTAPDSLVSQHSLVISNDHTTVFTVNAGDDSISALSVDQTSGALKLLKKSAATAGHMPNSLTLNNGYLYATFLSGSSQLAAYKIQADGSLSLVGAYDLTTLARLSSPAAPTQATVTPDGTSLVVNAGTGSNAILSFPINADGTLGTPVSNTTQIVTPFASAFLPAASGPVYLVTNASMSALAEFNYSAGALSQIGVASAAAIPGVAAPCWLVLNAAGTIAYVGNGSGVISTYAVTPTGLTLLNAEAAKETGVKTGVTAVAGDSWISPDGKFLYAAYFGDDKVVAYSIGIDGSLAKVGESVIGTATGLSLEGLAGI